MVTVDRLQHMMFAIMLLQVTDNQLCFGAAQGAANFFMTFFP